MHISQKTDIIPVKMPEIPSVSQISIELGMLYASHESKFMIRQVHLATNVGVRLDDCIDFVHRGHNVKIERKLKLFDRYNKSFNLYVKNYPDDKNIYWLCSGIVKTESLAFCRDKWNPDTSKKYRESVNAVWAIYLGSLLNKTDINLDESLPINQNDVSSKLIKYVYNNPFCEKARIFTAQIFLGSMIFQSISDWEKKEFAFKNNIPSFGGIGYEDLNEVQAKETVDDYTNKYLQAAESFGMNKSTLLKMASLLRLSKKIPKPLLINGAIKDWHYS